MTSFIDRKPLHLKHDITKQIKACCRKPPRCSACLDYYKRIGKFTLSKSSTFRTHSIFLPTINLTILLKVLAPHNSFVDKIYLQLTTLWKTQITVAIKRI